jgi:DNA-binding transcriptional MerR regulator
VDRRRLLSIGRFARITGLTVRALRHYHELGLLRPVMVDPDSGYRYYEPLQAADALAVRRLRDIELPLDDIGALLASRDSSALASSLADHRARMAVRAEETARILREVDRYLTDPRAVFAAPDASAVELRDVTEQHSIAVHARVCADELGPPVVDAFRRGRAFLLERDVEPSGPPTLVAPFADEEGIHELDAAWPVESPVDPDGDVSSMILPACRVVAVRHRGPYDDLDRAYRALARYIDERGLAPAAAPREMYLTDPEHTQPADALTDVLWPVAPDKGPREAGRGLRVAASNRRDG